MDGTLFTQAFSAVFLGELGDKTQLMVLALGARGATSRTALLAGASSALWASAALSVFLGRMLSSVLAGERSTHTIAGAVFLSLGVLTLWHAYKRSREAPASEEVRPEAVGSPGRTFLVTFALVFLAELADKTQFALTSLAAVAESPLSVFLGGGLGFTASVVLGVLGAEWIAKRISPSRLEALGGAVFCLIGAAYLSEMLRGM